MANRMLWRYGETNPIMAAVDSAQVIEIGDILYLNTDDARPVSQYTYGDSLGATQEAIIDTGFLGVAMQQSRNGDTDEIRVATNGVFEFDCASATFEVGDLVGVDDNSDGDTMMDQQVIAVNHPALAIGRVAKRVTSAATKVLVRIKSSVMEGGVQAGISSG